MAKTDISLNRKHVCCGDDGGLGGWGQHLGGVWWKVEGLVLLVFLAGDEA